MVSEVKFVEDLPTEIQIEIIHHLDPHDALSLSETCKAAHDLLRDRGMWIAILRSMCKEHELLMSSYPVDDMDLLDIQRAALGPTRWKSKVKSQSRYPGEENLDSMKRSPKHMLPGDTFRRSPCLFLVPGGRFFLEAEWGSSSIKLWDLGFVGRGATTTPILLAESEVDHGDGFRITALTAQPVNGEDLRVAVSCIYDKRFKVFSISPQAKRPHFQTIAALRVTKSPVCDNPTWSMALVANRMLIQYDVVSIIWDFVTNRCATLVTREISSPDFKTLFTGDMMVQFTTKALLVWAVPALDFDLDLPAGHLSFDGITQANPSPTNAFPFEVPHNCTVDFSLPSNWHLNYESPIMFDVFFCPDDFMGPKTEEKTSTQISRFKLEPDGKPTLVATARLPDSYNYTPCDRQVAGMVDFGFSSSNVLLRGGCGHERYQCCIYSLHLGAQANQDFDPDNGIAPTGTVSLTALGKLGYTQAPFSLCMASGRLVEYERNWDMRAEGRTSFVDFL